jgi:hypothetical protein
MIECVLKIDVHLIIILLRTEYCYKVFTVQECKEWKTLKYKPIVSGCGGEWSLDQEEEYIYMRF